MRRNAAQFGAMRRNSAQFGAMRRNAAHPAQFTAIHSPQFSAMRRNAAQRSAAGAKQRKAAQFGAVDATAKSSPGARTHWKIPRQKVMVSGGGLTGDEDDSAWHSDYHWLVPIGQRDGPKVQWRLPPPLTFFATFNQSLESSSLHASTQIQRALQSRLLLHASGALLS